MKKSLITILLFVSINTFSAQVKTVSSPDNSIKVEVSIDKDIAWSVLLDGKPLIEPSVIELKFENDILGVNPKLSKSSVKEVREYFPVRIYNRSKVKNHYNELTLNFKNNYTIAFRVFDDGIAYRWITDLKNDQILFSEKAEFNFSGESQKAYVGYVNAREQDVYSCSFENVYKYINLDEMSDFWPAFAPIVVEMQDGVKCGITESDLFDYPGMFLRLNQKSKKGLIADFAPYPSIEEQGGHNNLQNLVKKREPYIAKVAGTRTYPWRTVIIAREDKDLLETDMVYKLATPSKLTDDSWVKPGKLAWDYWNDWNIYNVDFRAGVNTDTYKFYIDFASKNKIEYVLLDEGWSVKMKADLMQVVPEIDMKELISYAKERNVNLILWAGYYAFDRDLEQICKHYSEMGIKGFKVDFMDRDDQKMVRSFERMAETAAKYKLLINFHGSYKPTGLQRTYPNVITFEGVYGMEYLKGDYPDMPENDATIPYVRMLAGPVDYTPGAMFNANKKSYKGIWSIPMSQGTRAHQVALYIVFQSPLSMLADSPNNYMKEQETTNYIASIPTIFDNTVAMDGKIGKYVAIAKRYNDKWYVGAISNWEARELDVDFSFLDDGKWQAKIFRDGINSDRNGNDYKIENVEVDSNTKLKIKLAEGGGWSAIITKINQ